MKGFFFVPFDSLNGARHLSDILLKGISYNDKQAFIFDSDKNEVYIKKFCGKELSFKKNKYQFNEPYYYVEGDQQNTYLYNIQYMEGKAIKTEIENSHSHKVYLGLNYRIDSNLKFFNCFFVHSITLSEQRLSEDRSIKIWK